MSANFWGLGNVGADPDFSTVGKDETALVKMNVAFNRRVKEGDGWVSKPTWLKCQAWNGQAEAISKMVKKGTKVLISGELSQESWTDKSGETRTGYVVNIRNWELISGTGKPSAEDVKAPVAKTEQNDFVEEDAVEVSSTPF